MADGETFEMLVCETGWVEIRNPEDSDHQWLMADTTVEVRQGGRLRVDIGESCETDTLAALNLLYTRTFVERVVAVPDDDLKSLAALLNRARTHVAEHFRSKHRLGRFEACPATCRRHEIGPCNEGDQSGVHMGAYETHGWEQFSETIRHELVYTRQYNEFGEADYGVTFAQ